MADSIQQEPCIGSLDWQSAARNATVAMPQHRRYSYHERRHVPGPGSESGSSRSIIGSSCQYRWARATGVQAESAGHATSPAGALRDSRTLSRR
eukprot:3226227-Rhodomonas_salina.1